VIRSGRSCCCGAQATFEVSLFGGTRYFCEAHRTDGQRLFERAMGRRPTISKSDLGKVAGFIKALDLKPVAVRVLPDEVVIMLSGGEDLMPPLTEDEIEAKYRQPIPGRQS
jgi:hypothetical protein